MKSFIFVFIFSTVMTMVSCGNKVNNVTSNDSTKVDSIKVDSIEMDSVLEDSILMDTSIYNIQ